MSAIRHRCNKREAIKVAFSGFDMRHRGMKFVGSTTVYAFLQAAGYIDAHGPGCDLVKRRMS